MKVPVVGVVILHASGEEERFDDNNARVYCSWASNPASKCYQLTVVPHPREDEDGQEG